MPSRSRSNLDKANEHASRFSTAKYYEDIGASATREGYEKLMDQISSFDTRMATAEGEYAKGKGAYDRAMDTNSVLADAWKTASKDFTTINIYDGTKLEGAYKLPKEAAFDFQQKIKDFYHTAVIDGNLNIDVKTKGSAGGGKRGYELHKALYEGQQDLYNSFVSEALPQIQSAQEGLSGAGAELASGRATMDAAIADKKNTLEGIRSDYQGRLEGIKSFLGGTTVERGKRTA